ncbi:hypothetical protein FS749_007832 [Ceratobasidium sp. UAMH 11750]|nr:hypothetical protein FS749_007832 [Ceratobasidium sp. UAMH 11750]
MSIPPSSFSSSFLSNPSARNPLLPNPPKPTDPEWWSTRVISSLTSAFDKPHFGPDRKLSNAYKAVRAKLLTCINALDDRIAEKDFSILRSCPKSCPGLGSGHTTPKPAAPVSHKAVATDPPPPTTPVVETMDLDPPPVATTTTYPVPRTYASVAVGTLSAKNVG